MLGNANGHKKSKIMDFETSPLWGMSGERDTFTVHTIYLLFAINSKRKGCNKFKKERKALRK